MLFLFGFLVVDASIVVRISRRWNSFNATWNDTALVVRVLHAFFSTFVQIVGEEATVGSYTIVRGASKGTDDAGRVGWCYIFREEIFTHHVPTRTDK